MRLATIVAASLLVTLVWVPGCAPKSNPTPTGSRQVQAAEQGSKHVHGKGPHGGVVFDLGRFHAEFTVDHEKKECAIYMLGDDETTPVAVAAKELTLHTKPTQTADGKPVPAMTIKLLPKDPKEGKAILFVGTDPGLGNVADFAGTVLGEINGKPAQGEFKEEDHDAKPEKK